MGHSNGIITSPPNLEDLRQVLGDPHLRLNDLGVSPNINPFSKHKFVRSAKLDDLTEAELRDTNYGLQLHTAFTPDLLEQGFEYLRPDGIAWYFRLDDMIDYKHNAMAPISGIGDFSLSTLSRTQTIFFQQQKGSLFDDIRLSEFPALANFYPCLVIYTTTTSGSRAFICKTGEYTFGEGVQQYIDITYNELSQFAGKSLEYMLCGFSAKQTSFDESQQFGQFISLPSADALTGRITIKTSVSINMEFIYITSRIVAGKNNTFSYLSTFSGPVSIEGSSWRYGVGTTGNIALVGRITNNENVTYNMTRMGIKVEAYPNLVSTQRPTILPSPNQMFEMTMLGAAVGSAEEITGSSSLKILPGETKYVGFNMDALAFRLPNGTTAIPSTDAQADMDINFKLGTALLGGVFALRIKTGDSTKGDIIDPGPIVPIDPIEPSPILPGI